MIVRSPEDIARVILWARTSNRNGDTANMLQTFEDGVQATIEWMLGESDFPPDFLERGRFCQGEWQVRGRGRDKRFVPATPDRIP